MTDIQVSCPDDLLPLGLQIQQPGLHGLIPDHPLLESDKALTGIGDVTSKDEAGWVLECHDSPLGASRVWVCRQTCGDVNRLGLAKHGHPSVALLFFKPPPAEGVDLGVDKVEEGLLYLVFLDADHICVLCRNVRFEALFPYQGRGHVLISKHKNTLTLIQSLDPLPENCGKPKKYLLEGRVEAGDVPGGDLDAAVGGLGKDQRVGHYRVGMRVDADRNLWCRFLLLQCRSSRFGSNSRSLLLLLGSSTGIVSMLLVFSTGDGDSFDCDVGVGGNSLGGES